MQPAWPICNLRCLLGGFLAAAALAACSSPKAIDNSSGNQLPVVSIDAPSAGATIVVGTVTDVTANATDADGTVSQVEFFDGATSLGVDNAAPYGLSWTPSVTGAHSLTAKATDDSGAVATSAVVSVTIADSSGGPDTQAPVVTGLDPVDGTTGILTSVVATATATDNVGVVAVEFQLDGEALGETTSSPFKLALPPLADFTTGPHQIRARARDAAGNLSAWALSRFTIGGAVNQPLGFVRSTAFSGSLGGGGTAMAFAPDGRLFICEQGGALRVVKNGSLLATPFVTVPTLADGERGLLGVAFHPQFGTAGNNFVYLYYTVTIGSDAHNRISRFAASGDVASGAEEVIFDLLPTLGPTNHNGGAIHFGPDGMLYVAVGENATGPNAQSNTTLLGKILRLKPDGSIPTDNPTLGTGNFKAIWAKGVRNPFTFSFQPGSGRMFINDVGENTWEEINEGAAGANYGWPGTEGATTASGITGPIFTYRHSGGAPVNPSLVVGNVIVGSAFYNPSGAAPYPANYVGNYFFADYGGHWVNRLDLATGNDAVYAFARLPNSVTDLAVGPDGMLYALGAQSNNTWTVFRFDKN